MDIEISNPKKVIQFAVIFSNLKHILSEITFYNKYHKQSKSLKRAIG